ncbi:MAG: thiamine pyrophosphate-dependent dehydrogenase E1 component subunit alpha [Armatimonadota bacterium]|nr:thiamine pyrophosphate-dependent dehydrogenase E1 component subunit alpha [Armatimonadota bacterium]MCX7777817.1 thiamine pyrophosphate-dependent dehydrogenase E1 component subunit alpha [Armatimonadota bacterium]MDW8025931.1 thiamine pyrophosphate-dependent dehydrogenase E1 component subunit alpha [Armatimonadota bacterium]
MLPKEELLSYLRKMWLIRFFEMALDELFGKGLIKGTSHFCAGQEAVSVGACAALRPDDAVTSNHRGHGHFIAKGGDPKHIMAEIFGKATGYVGGRGGSQHMACFEIGFFGSNGITGGGIPVATGIALAFKLRGLDRVALCFFGDGAANTGYFHESLNMASIWKLPVIYLCENNFYAMSTPFDYAFPIEDVSERAAAYGIPSMIVDGNDVLAVREAVKGAAERARMGYGPMLIEAKTYRYYGHSKSDYREYRTLEEELDWKARDPITRFERFLVSSGVATQDEIDDIRKSAREEIDSAVTFAESSPEPDEQFATCGVFS